MLTNIKLARMIAGYSQTDFAKLVGVSPGAVSQWEQGKTFPSTGKLMKVSEVLNLPIEKILESGKKAG